MSKFTTKLWLAVCLLNLLPLNVRAGDTIVAAFVGVGLAFTVMDIFCDIVNHLEDKEGGQE